jgi:hypothetical protein
MYLFLYKRSDNRWNKIFGATIGLKGNALTERCLIKLKYYFSELGLVIHKKSRIQHRLQKYKLTLVTKCAYKSNIKTT